MTEVEMGAEDVRVLLSKARLSILRHLWRRRYTASELSKILGLTKPTVMYHLSILEKAGYVSRIEDGRKWIYYELTESGKRALKLKTVRVILASSLLAAVIALLAALMSAPKTEGISKPLGVASSEVMVVFYLVFYFLVLSIAIYASCRIIRC